MGWLRGVFQTAEDAGEMVKNIGSFGGFMCSIGEKLEMIYTVNKYLLIGLCTYSMYKLLKKFVYFPALQLYYTLLPFRGEELIRKYCNGWVVITGAGGGLGPAYTRVLANGGYRKFLLIGHSAETLERVKVEIEG